VRKLMWFSVGFGAACALAVYWIPGPLLVICAVLCLVLSFLLLGFRKRNWTRILGTVILGLCIGLWWYFGFELLTLSPVRKLDGQLQELTLKTSDYSWDTERGICVDASGELGGKQVKLRVYLNQQEALEPGATVAGTFLLRYTAPGGSKDATYHSGSGILLLAYQRGEVRTSPGEESWRYFPSYLRHRIEALMARLFPEDALPFAQALLLGDTSLLDYKTETALSVSGLRHVAAVSGLHISILFSLVFFFTRRNRVLSLLIGAPLLVLFAAMAGFSPSILRSSIMQMLMLLALALDREYDPPTALSFAALCMLAVNPLAVTAVGLQLSIASVAGIFLFSGKIQAWLMDERRLGRWKGKTRMGRLARRFSASVSVSMGALLTTTPLTAWYFGTVSLLSVLINLICLWAVTYLFCGIIIACILGALWLPAGKLLGWCLGWIVRYVLGVAGLAARFPLSAVYTDSPYIVAWLVFVYLLLAVFVLSREKKPLLLGCCAVLSLCLSLGASWTEPLLDNYRITALDVGQGQCILLQRGGKTFMVDCGGSYDEGTADTAAQFLLSQGITNLDGLILTHHDRDHIGAVQYLLQRISTDLLILPQGNGAFIWEPDLLAEHEGEVLRCTENLLLEWEGAALTVFASWNLKSTNESSLCVLFQTEKCDILITGDRSDNGEELLMLQTELPLLDVLVVGHHGAASSTGEALLAATQPRLALISVGRNNSYGHPAQSVLDRLTAWGCRIRRTDLEGTIIIRG